MNTRLKLLGGYSQIIGGYISPIPPGFGTPARMMHQMTKTIFKQRMVVPAGSPEDSDIEQEMIIEQEEEYDSDKSVKDEPVPQNVSSIWIA